MEEQINEAVEKISTGGKRVKKGNKKPLVIIGAIAAVLSAAYVGLCAYANSLDTFYPNYAINDIDVSGLTAQEARQTLDESLPAYEIPIYDESHTVYSEGSPLTPLLTVTLADLGFDPETIGQSATSYEEWVATGLYHLNEKPFLYKGWDYVQHLMGNRGGAIFSYILEGDKFEAAVDSIQQQLTLPAVDSGFTLEENAIQITKAKDGYSVDRSALKEKLSQAGNTSIGVWVTLEPDSAVVLTAQDIHDQVAGEMKNAGYDAETDSITPERVGAEFDVKAAQSALDAAQPGETVKIPAVIEYPAVTAEVLEGVLFRDVLGECQTHVSGTAARISNVKLSASSINGYVMNTGDVFSYNGVVGQRTAANGYQAAPAYVQGETVDEIGGGICQTSSTLYLACLRSNLEITERYAHRYVPAYIPWGMDATVSWGGPDYKFTNDTDYPIKIVTEYKNNYLTVKILGTNADGSYAKVTNETLSTTPWETVYEEDETLAPGTPETVKTTPYTGYKVKTYHTIYDKDGNIIDSHYEATSDYKVRNKVIVRAPQPEVTTPVTPAAPSAETPADTGTTVPADPVVDTGAEAPVTDAPETGDTPIILVPDLTASEE